MRRKKGRTVAMGNRVGVHSEKLVKALKPQTRAKLRAHVMRELLASKEIRAIIEKNPKILTRNAAIRRILKKKTTPTLRRLKGP
jgi:hypothetical protein